MKVGSSHDFFYPIKGVCQPSVFFQTELTDFPLLSYTSTSEMRTLLFIWSLKKIPLSGGASPYGIEFLPGPAARGGGGGGGGEE